MHLELNSAIKISQDLLSNAISTDFAGYDPFDHLNSKLIKNTPLYKNELFRLAWLQLGKRSIINFRNIFCVPPMRNPKGIGVFILGLIQDYLRTGEYKFIEYSIKLADWLLEERSTRSQWKHSCWGYHFDWQARAFYVPAGKPNVISTCYIARSLFELGQITKIEKYTEAALDSAYFISKNLYSEIDDRKFYAYIPGEQAFVHNANLWGAAWCIFAGLQLNDKNLVNQGMAAARQSVSEQATDGSWVYGARHHHQFIDGFHTGYNLEALHFIKRSSKTDELDESIIKGYQFYVRNFIEEDGSVKYYSNNKYPLDMHSFAQAILTLINVGGDISDIRLCSKVIQSSISQLYIKEKSQFIYQKTRWVTNKINYTRWTQAWSYYSFAFYNRYCTELYHAKN